jgi:phage repressor protein C with HTH and peptisase S24 domain
MKKGEKKKEFAERMAIRPTILSRYFQDQVPDPPNLIKIAQKTGGDIHWLLTGAEALRPFAGVPEFKLMTYQEWKKSMDDKETRENYVAIPLVAGAASCGPGAVAEDEIESFVIIYQEWCRNPENYRAIRITGNSMLPTLHDGDLVAINITLRAPGQLSTKLIALNVDGECYIKRLIRAKTAKGKPGPWMASSDNRAEYDDIVDIEPDQILGKVEWAWTRFK